MEHTCVATELWTTAKIIIHFSKILVFFTRITVIIVIEVYSHGVVTAIDLQRHRSTWILSCEMQVRFFSKRCQPGALDWSTLTRLSGRLLIKTQNTETRRWTGWHCDFWSYEFTPVGKKQWNNVDFFPESKIYVLLICSSVLTNVV